MVLSNFVIQWKYASKENLKQKPITGASNCHLGLRHGVFTDQFIFRHNLKHFSRENKIFTTSIIEVQDMKKV